MGRPRKNDKKRQRFFKVRCWRCNAGTFAGDTICESCVYRLLGLNQLHKHDEAFSTASAGRIAELTGLAEGMLPLFESG